MAYNKLNALTRNSAVIQLLLDLSQKPTLELTDQQFSLLKSYSGYGAIKEILYRPDSNLWNKLPLNFQEELSKAHTLFQQYADIKGTSYENVLENVKVSTFTAFYTPTEITKTITDNLSELFLKNSTLEILEPSVGHGAFLDALKTSFNAHSYNATALEKDVITADIAATIYNAENLKVFNAPLESSINPHQKYDLILSNIPFGDISVFDRNYTAALIPDPEDLITAKQSQKRIHNYFFTKAVNQLNDNGIIAFITTNAFMNTPNNEKYRKFLFEHCELITAVRFPDTMFKENAGTEAQTDLLVIKKRPSKVPLENLPSVYRALVQSSDQGGYFVNDYFQEYPEAIIHSEIKIGTNQYGNPAQNVVYNGTIGDIGKELHTILNTALVPYIYELPVKQVQGSPISPPIVNELQETTVNTYQKEKQIQAQFHKDLEEEKQEFRNTYKEKKKRNTKAAVTAQLSLFDLFSQPVPEQTNDHVKDPVARPKEVGVLEEAAPKKFVTIEELPFADVGHKATLLYDGLSFTKYEYNPLQKNFSASKIADIAAYAKDNYGLRKLDKTQFISLLNIQNKYLQLFDSEYKNQKEDPVLRSEFNKAYDSFVKNYGVLNKASNRNLLNVIIDYKYELQALEIPKTDQETEKVTYHKSEIFYSPVNIKSEGIKVFDAQSALMDSINRKGIVDMNMMATKVGLDIPTLYNQLKGVVLFDPKAKDFKLKNVFLNQNLYTLYDQFNSELNSYTKQEIEIYKNYLKDTKSAILDNTPDIIPFPFIDVSLGERWVDKTYYEQFLSEHLETPTEIYYNAASDEYEVFLNRYSYIPREQYAVQGIGGTKSPQSLIKQALLNQNVTVTYSVPDGDKRKILVDEEATKKVSAKVEQLRLAWDKWIQNEEKKEIHDKLETTYNRLFNGISLQEYDGSLLDLSDMNLKGLGIENVYDTQRNCLMMLLMNEGGIADHIPGAGKTIIECMAAHYMKKIGVAKKPIIIGLKANINDLVATYRKAFPQDKIIAPSDSDFTAKNRHIFLNQVKNNNWDCVFLSHEQFKSIPISLEVEQININSEMLELQNAHEFLTKLQQGDTRATVKGIEKQLENLRSTLAQIQHDIGSKKDNVISFDRLGIDHIIIDESHVFKNLRFATKHQNIAGIGNTNGSQRAFNLLNAIRSIQFDKGKELQASFFTGTPLSNSISELYLLFKYLTPLELQRKGIASFDAWAAAFTRKSSELELDLTNQLRVRERFREYVKLPELIKDYRKIADIRDEHDIGLDKPMAMDQLVTLPKTAELEDLFSRVLKFIEEKNPSYINADYDTSQLSAASLIGINLCEQGCMDMRMVDPNAPDHPHNKINEVVRRTLGLENNFKDRLKSEFGLNDKDVAKNQPTQLIFCDKGTPATKKDFSIYFEVKKKLIEAGYKEDEVQFIHSFKTQNQKRALQAHMDNGTVKVLLGSTSTLGTGNNYQGRVIAMHNLDITFKPSEIDQRKGRGARPGNWLAKKYNDNKVDNFFYLVENSPEVGKLDYVKTKQHFIQQIKKGSLNIRSFTESTMADDGSLSYSDMVAQLSGSLDYIKQNKLENKLKNLEYQKTVFYDTLKKQEKNIKLFTSQIPVRESKITVLKEHLTKYESQQKFTADEKRINETKILGKHFSTEEELGQYLINLSENPKINNDNKVIKLGNLYDFSLFVKPGHYFDYDGNHVVLNTFCVAKDDLEYTHNSGMLSSSNNPIRAARHFYYALDLIPSIIEKETNKVNMDIKELEQAKIFVKQPFLQEESIKNIKQEIKDIKEKIIKDISEKKSPADEHEEEAAINPKIKHSI